MQCVEQKRLIIIIIFDGGNDEYDYDGNGNNGECIK